jgi:hypothetical protein
MYSGEVIKNDSCDPQYKVKFSFENDMIKIKEASAIFIRQSPYPKVIFDDFTDYSFEKLEIDEETINHIKLQIGNTVFDYIYNILG